MPHIGIRELQRRTSPVVAQVERGDPLVITRHNRPVALLAGITSLKGEIRRSGLDRLEARRVMRELERFMWAGRGPPLNVLIAEICGDRPVREFLYED